MLGLILAVAVALPIVGAILGIAAFRRTRRLEAAVDALRAEIRAMTGRDALAAEEPTEADTESSMAGPPSAGPPDQADQAPVTVAPTFADEPAAPPDSADEAPVTAGPASAEEPAPQVAASSAASPPTDGGTRPAVEQRLASRWLVWLGGVALALGGAFLVKYSIDRGLLGPGVRVSLGVALGLALTVGGEWLRRRPLSRAVAALGPDQVPQALTAAGVATTFAAVYTAYALYDLIPAVVALVLLAGISFAALVLSIAQGPLVAALGQLGAFIVPALVSTTTPSAWTLFPYILLVAAGCQALARRVDRPWMAWLTVAGTMVWPAFWMLFAWRGESTPVLAGYLLALFALFHLFRLFRAPPAGTGRGAHGVLWTATIALAVLVFALVRVDGYGTVALGCLLLFCSFGLVAGRRAEDTDAVVVPGAALTAATLATWHVPTLVPQMTPRALLDAETNHWIDTPVLPPELVPFAVVAGLVSALFAGGGFLALRGARRPALWPAVSAAVPVAVLVLTYWRFRAFGVDLAWASLGLGVTALSVEAARRLLPSRAQAGMTDAIGLYAAGAVAGLAFALTLTLEEAWLSVGLALLLPGLAWIDRRLDLGHIRALAAVLAVVVLARLALNPYVLDYAVGTMPGFGWIIYGYGLPAAALYAAARGFAPSGDARLVTLLEAGALALGVLFCSLEIRELVAGRIGYPGYDLYEASLHTVVWLAIAFALYRGRRTDDRPALYWGARILAGGAVIHLVLLQLLHLNPLVTGAPVGAWPVINQLALAYGAPALLAVLIAWEADRQKQPRIATGAGILALVLLFAWLSLQIRHAFHGSVLAFGPTSTAEWYAYSIGWLIYAGVLMALGLVTGRRPLRFAGLATLLVVVAKVFLFDMAELTGLYRAASFLGLGVSLVGIGYLYQRFVFPPGTAGADAMRESGRT